MPNVLCSVLIIKAYFSLILKSQVRKMAQQARQTNSVAVGVTD
jgi:hypothetical protein